MLPWDSREVVREQKLSRQVGGGFTLRLQLTLSTYESHSDSTAFEDIKTGRIRNPDKRLGKATGADTASAGMLEKPGLGDVCQRQGYV